MKVLITETATHFHIETDNKTENARRNEKVEKTLEESLHKHQNYILKQVFTYTKKTK